MKTTFLFISLGQFLVLLQADITGYRYTAEQADYVIEAKHECHYMNGTQRVRYLHRYFYNQEEQVYFDSDKGYYIPKTEMGRSAAEQFNKNKELIEQRKAYVQTYCIHNYEAYENMGIPGRRVPPSVKISLIQHYEDSQTNHHMLMCSVSDFYPSVIEVKWYRNGQEEISQAQSTELYQNGDWTSQILVMLETDIQKEDTFTCEVHHSSLETPIKIDWHPQKSDSAKSKEATGIVGFVLGIVFILVGVVVYLRGRKAQLSFRGPQVEAFLH